MCLHVVLELPRHWVRHNADCIGCSGEGYYSQDLSSSIGKLGKCHSASKVNGYDSTPSRLCSTRAGQCGVKIIKRYQPKVDSYMNIYTFWFNKIK